MTQPSGSDGSKSGVGNKPAAANSKDSSGASKEPASPSIPSASRTAVEEDYRIGAGDVLSISVWKEPEASIGSITVRPDGKITLPLLKDIEVSDLTPREAEKVITRGLAAFIPDANVTVIVTGTHSKKIYIIGAVKHEGPLPYTYRMTIMQALTEAGGLTDFAKRKKIYVLRAQRGKETRIPFDYDSILKGKDMEHVLLLPNDTVVVPH
jgi:polysaccharide export outer membrane protein